MTSFTTKPSNKKHLSFSGIYPHLAWTNGDEQVEELECGTGAVVPWAGKLWYITYPAHQWNGSNDKLHYVDDQLQVTEYPHSVGGTHANRMIHRESNQLIIGPYFINSEGNVRVIPPDRMSGRLTAAARHLTDPEHKVYFYTMESGLYEVNVYTLEVTTLYQDPNHYADWDCNQDRFLLPGRHGKGCYTGQGRLVVSNNGVGGVLAEWTGLGDPGRRENWSIVDANKFSEITGPGGLYGAPDADAPLWALGWDDQSVLLRLCQDDIWTRYRLPMGSFTHIADHGWFTEWPRIRDIGWNDKWLMDMFGMLFEFPAHFQRGKTAGIRPISTHHKMIVDYAEWNGSVVMGCNDASVQMNPLLGRCQSNLMFTTRERLKEMGTPAGWGGVWSEAVVQDGVPSEPYLFAGFQKRVLHLKHNEAYTVTFNLELDIDGTGIWTLYDSISVAEDEYQYYTFPLSSNGEWIRMVPDRDAAGVSAYFHYSNVNMLYDDTISAALANADKNEARTEAMLYVPNDLKLPLYVAAAQVHADGHIGEMSYYEVNGQVVMSPRPELTEARDAWEQQTPVCSFTVDSASVLITSPKGQRYRLPKGAPVFDEPSPFGHRRDIREVVTERQLMNAHGTFFELPDESSGGLHRIVPICTHNKLIYDFCSWRGMFVLSGVSLDSEIDQHTVISTDGKVKLWLGNVDDLRKFGAPQGIGGPWNNTPVRANEPSDPYLMTGYQNKRVEFQHNQPHALQVLLEVDFQGTGNWVPYLTLELPPQETVVYSFPDAYSAHWIRLTADKDAKATATFYYD